MKRFGAITPVFFFDALICKKLSTIITTKKNCRTFMLMWQNHAVPIRTIMLMDAYALALVSICNITM